MENKAIARNLRLLSQLMELHEENSFKIKSLSSAAYTIDKLPYPLSKKTLPEIESINGIGKSTAAKVWELLQTGNMGDLSALLVKTPGGIVEIMGIKGIGPKKVLIIWKELGIENPGELLYACNENRLIEAKGFGLKTQEEIKKAIEFMMASKGRFLYAHIENEAENLIKQLGLLLPGAKMSFAGAYRRKCEIIDFIDILIGTPWNAGINEKLGTIAGLSFIAQESNVITAETTGIKIKLHFSSEEEFITQLFLLTGSDGHVDELMSRLNNTFPDVSSEEEIYHHAGFHYLEPELREGITILKHSVPEVPIRLIEYTDLKGSLHNHSTWSDGVNSLEEMALYCRDQLKLEYLGISDHSKTAFYAKGLSEERVLAQHQEIDILNQKLAPFRIFKGIESDILFDGSLDYAPEILSTFDFVVASIHSVFRMNEEKATSRLITAIENPYTTILGHPTGRMFLTRNGYPVDFKKVIDACAANGVVIEINSNPLRLDLDWRWHQYALERGVMLSVNPDAHSNKGFNDMRYGVFIARKGGVTAKSCLNALSREEIDTFFKNRRLI